MPGSEVLVEGRAQQTSRCSHFENSHRGNIIQLTPGTIRGPDDKGANGMLLIQLRSLERHTSVF